MIVGLGSNGAAQAETDAPAQRRTRHTGSGGVMHTVFAIFLRDVKRILRNPVALVVTMGVAIIPSLYAWCNILANWDPYANTAIFKSP